MCEGDTTGNLMHAQMSHGTTLLELPGMGSHMAQQMRVAAETTSTQHTGVRPCTCVNQQVAQQVGAAIEALATLRALLGVFQFLP